MDSLHNHTDLAIELKEELEHPQAEQKRRYYQYWEQQLCDGRIVLSGVEILNRRGEALFGKPKGNYITMEVPELHRAKAGFQREIVQCLASAIQKLPIWDRESILLAGIGNRDITSDSLGPKTVTGTCVNRHVRTGRSGHRLSAIVPGVMYQTGMETMEIVRGVIRETKPDLLIVVDALAARDLRRVNRTIQICDTGLAPGSGMNHPRLTLDESSLGVPVIAIGVPTVVSTLTIYHNILSQLQVAGSAAEPIPLELASTLADTFVTTKNIDEEVQCLSIILSKAIEVCYGITEEESMES